MSKSNKKINVFSFINSINNGKGGKHLLIDSKADDTLETSNPDAIEKQYVPFIINRSFSNFKDTVLFANEMNFHPTLPARMQYDFYRNIVTVKRRFSKWGKKKDKSADVAIIQKEYNYSREKAETVYPIFSDDAIKALRKKHDLGGKQ
jgi:hypothetical protein